MFNAIRSARIVVVSFLASVFLVLTTTSANAGTVLMIGGVAAGDLPDLVMANVFAGRYRNDTRVNVGWPAQARPYTGPFGLTLGESIGVGITNLTGAIGQGVAALKPNETLTVVGLSAGSLVVDEVLRQVAASPNAPSKGQLTFVLAADSSRQATITGQQSNSVLGYTFQPPPETKYDIEVVTQEYDGNADFPDRIFNLVAVANALAGGILLHDFTFFADLSTVPGTNITTTTNSVGGKTTTYLVPTAQLPLVTLVPLLGLFEPALKAIVDAGYSRNDAPTAAVSTTSASAARSETTVTTFAAPTEVAETKLASEESGETPVVGGNGPSEAAEPAAAAVADEAAAESTVSGNAADETADQATPASTADADESTAAGAGAGAATKPAKETDDRPTTPTAAAGRSKPAKSGDGVGVVTKRQIPAKKETTATSEAPADDASSAPESTSTSAASPSAGGGGSTTS